MKQYEQYAIDNKEYFEKVEAYLINKGLLHFSNPDLKTVSSLEEFFSANRNCATRELDEKFQCYQNRNRSIGDIFRIMKYYNPDITLAEIYIELIDNIVYKSLICHDIYKRVWWMKNNNYTQHYYFEGVERDEFDIQYPNVSTNEKNKYAEYLKKISI